MLESFISTTEILKLIKTKEATKLEIYCERRWSYFLHYRDWQICWSTFLDVDKSKVEKQEIWSGWRWTRFDKQRCDQICHKMTFKKLKPQEALSAPPLQPLEYLVIWTAMVRFWCGFLTWNNLQEFNQSSIPWEISNWNWILCAKEQSAFVV